MTSKHTPGPWAYRPTNSGHFIAGSGENSGYLAEVRHCRSNQDVKADARLIAAAPELLEALRAYEAAFDDLFAQCLSNGMTNAWGKPVSHTLLNEAHSLSGPAIAKATGESK